MVIVVIIVVFVQLWRLVWERCWRVLRRRSSRQWMLSVLRPRPSMHILTCSRKQWMWVHSVSQSQCLLAKHFFTCSLASTVRAGTLKMWSFEARFSLQSANYYYFFIFVRSRGTIVITYKQLLFATVMQKDVGLLVVCRLTAVKMNGRHWQSFSRHERMLSGPRRKSRTMLGRHRFVWTRKHCWLFANFMDAAHNCCCLHLW